MSKNFTDKCFVCDETDNSNVLNSCQTLYLGMQVRKISQELADTKLLAKLSEGDMVALEVRDLPWVNSATDIATIIGRKGLPQINWK